MRLFLLLLFCFSFFNLLGINSVYCFTDAENATMQHENVFSNSGVELGLKDWQANGGTSTRAIETTNKLRGKASVKFTSSGATDYLSITPFAIPHGPNCALNFYYKTTSSAFIVDIMEGANVVATKTLPSASTFINTDLVGVGTLTWTCTNSATTYHMHVRGGAAADIIYIDDLYLGKNLNIGTVAQAKLVGKVNFGADCDFTNSGGYTDITDASCTITTEGNVNSIAGFKGGVSIPNASSGNYMFVFSGRLQTNNAGNNNSNWRFYDGTNQIGYGYYYIPNVNSGLMNFTANRTYTTSPGTLNVTLQCSNAGTTNCGFGMSGNDSISVYYFPSQSETVVNASNANQFAATRWNFGTNGTFSSGAVQNINIAGADAARVNYGKATNQSTANDFALKINSLPPGGYTVYFSSILAAEYSGGAATCEFYITDGTTTRMPIIATQETNTDTRGVLNNFSAYFEYSFMADRTFTVQVRKISANGQCRLHSAYGVNNTDTMLTVIPVTPQISMPQIVNSVVTSYAGVTRIESVRVGGVTNATKCTSSPCTLYYNTGGISSVTWSATGTYALNFVAGTFSQPPNCVASVDNNHSSGNLAAVADCTTSTCAITTVNSSTFAAGDALYGVICHGIK